MSAANKPVIFIKGKMYNVTGVYGINGRNGAMLTNSNGKKYTYLPPYHKNSPTSPNNPFTFGNKFNKVPAVLTLVRNKKRKSPPKKLKP